MFLNNDNCAHAYDKNPESPCSGRGARFETWDMAYTSLHDVVIENLMRRPQIGTMPKKKITMVGGG